MHLLGEALIVGLTFMLMFIIMHTVSMLVLGDKAMTHPALFTQAFASAALFHLTYDILGLNKVYCASKKDD